jgi:hypothetical protein
MHQIISKLSVTGEEKMYLINNVSVGLDWALNHKKVKRDKFVFSKLLLLYKEVCELKHPYRLEDVNYQDLSTAIRISQEAISILEDIE